MAILRIEKAIMRAIYAVNLIEERKSKELTSLRG